MPGNVSKSIIPPETVEFTALGYRFQRDGKVIWQNNGTEYHATWLISFGKVKLDTGYEFQTPDKAVQEAYDEAQVNRVIMEG